MLKFAPGCTTSIAILGSQGMEEMAQNVHRILTDPNGQYRDDRFEYAPVPCRIFPGGELYPNLGNVRIKNKDIFLFHPMRDPDPNTSLVKLYLTLDALARATVNKVTPVLPYPSYFRQDRKDKPRVAISAKAVADLLTAKDIVERIIIMDMHSDQGQGFFNIPVDNLQGSLVLADYFIETLGDEINNTVTVSPDHGGSKRNRRFAKYAGIQDFSLDKWRDEKGIEIPKVTCAEDLFGKTVILFDDELASGETAITAAGKIMDCKAKAVYIVVTHLIACQKEEDTITVEEKFRQAHLARGIRVVTTNTIPRPKKYLKENASWLTVVPVDEVLAHTIHEGTLIGGSISSILERPKRLRS